MRTTVKVLIPAEEGRLWVDGHPVPVLKRKALLTDVTLEIDLERLAQRLGVKAARSRSRRSVLMGGIVKVRSSLSQEKLTP